MYKGVTAVFVLAIAIAGCGGDDDDSAVNDSCTPNMKSTPTGTKEDPCPQNDPACPADKYSAVATCDSSGHWKKDMASLITCECVPKAGSGAQTGASMSKGMCGNGVLEMANGEQCDGAALGGATCATLMPGSSKMLQCTSDCKFDMEACKETAMTGEGGDGM